LVAADYHLVFAPRQHWLHEAKLLQAAGQRLDLGVGDAARVRRVRAQVVDRDFDDGKRGSRRLHLISLLSLFSQAGRACHAALPQEARGWP